MDMILMGGLWLTADVWHEVADGLSARGHRAVPLMLPGQGDGNTAATLEDQLAVGVAAVDAAAGRPLVIGHSASCTLAWLTADRRAEGVAAVGLIGGFPSEEGDAYADFFDIVDGGMPFPGWVPFAGPDSADLDEAAKESLAAGAVPVPQGVTKARVHYTDERRHEVPVALICPEFTPQDAKDWIDAGDVPELSGATHLSYVDIPTGHWPMLSAPGQLADILADLADQHGDAG